SYPNSNLTRKAHSSSQSPRTEPTRKSRNNLAKPPQGFLPRETLARSFGANHTKLLDWANSELRIDRIGSGFSNQSASAHSPAATDVIRTLYSHRGEEGVVNIVRAVSGSVSPVVCEHMFKLIPQRYWTRLLLQCIDNESDDCS